MADHAGDTPYAFRYSRLIRIRWALSGPTLLALLGLTSSYAVRGVTSPSTQPVLVELDQYQVWPIAFGLAAIALVLAMLRRRYLEHAHVLAGAILSGYVAVLLWSVMSGAAWAAASLALAASATSFITAVVYQKGR